VKTWAQIQADLEESLDLDTAARALSNSGRHEEAKATAVEAQHVAKEAVHQLRRLVAAVESANWPQVRLLMRDQSVGA